MYKHKLLIANPIVEDQTFKDAAVFIFDHTKRRAEGVILNSKEEIGKVSFLDLSEFDLSSYEGPEDFMNHLRSDEELQKKVSYSPVLNGGPSRTPGMYFIHGYHEFKDCLKPQDLRNFGDIFGSGRHGFGNKNESEFDLGIPDSFDLGLDYQDGDQESSDGENEPVAEFFSNHPTKEDPFNIKQVDLIDGVYYGTPITFAAITGSGKAIDRRFKFYSGQATWGPGQLEDEVNRGIWTVMEINDDLFFNTEKLNQLIQSIKGATKPNTVTTSEKKNFWVPMKFSKFNQN